MHDNEREVCERDVRARLASHAENYEVVRKLHDVPPHVTHEVWVNGQRAVCKFARSDEGDPAMEARVAQHLDATTSVPVPEVLAVGDDFVAEWDDAVPDDPAVDAARTRTMGAGLATLHAEARFESHGFLEAEDDPLALDARGSWHETVCALLAGRREYLRGHDRGGDYVDVAADTLAFVRDHPDLFRGTGDPVLCHGNYLPEHVGIDGDDVTCVIDFEHALAGPGEYDYWRSAIPLSNRDEALASAFRAGYESVRVLPDGFDRRERVYRLVIAVLYFRSLFLQRRQTGTEAIETAERLRDVVYETMESLRG